MSWATKIDSKKYAFGSLINIGFALYSGWPNPSHYLPLAYMVVGASLNHFFTIQVFSRIVEARINSDFEGGKAKLMFNIVLKIFFLLTAFLCLLVFAREKVLQGLLMYIFQLIILFLSIKNIGQFIKKGPST